MSETSNGGFKTSPRANLDSAGSSKKSSRRDQTRESSGLPLSTWSSACCGAPLSKPCSSFGPGEQKDASNVNELAMPSSRHATTRPVAFFDICTPKLASRNEKSAPPLAPLAGAAPPDFARRRGASGEKDPAKPPDLANPLAGVALECVSLRGGAGGGDTALSSACPFRFEAMRGTTRASTSCSSTYPAEARPGGAIGLGGAILGSAQP
mmetsp:Transcript_21935/g.74381  ORF Transcript_21935/g.74381 Transcript_21935/m.74381 type:complete len:209 (+) Transcript_21935:1935-2561(+)